MSKRDPYWFLTKWRIVDITPIDNVYNRLEELEEKYKLILQDVVRLEEENIELTNELYRMENSLDARIDILAEHCRINYDV
jgi:hypothetical protein